MNTADYFSLASRVTSYLKVAVSIAQYEGYLLPFIDELLCNKICHWVFLNFSSIPFFSFFLFLFFYEISVSHPWKRTSRPFCKFYFEVDSFASLVLL